MMSMIGKRSSMRQRHVHSRHDRKVKGHVALVTIAKVRQRVLRPLIGFGQQHATRILLVHVRANGLEIVVRLRQVLAGRPFALEQIRNCVQAECVDTDVHPEIESLEKRLMDGRILEIEIGLMREEAMPVIGLGDRIPSPVRRLEILEDDPRVFVLVGRIAPDIEIAPGDFPASRGVISETRDADRWCD